MSVNGSVNNEAPVNSEAVNTADKPSRKEWMRKYMREYRAKQSNKAPESDDSNLQLADELKSPAPEIESPEIKSEPELNKTEAPITGEHNR